MDSYNSNIDKAEAEAKIWQPSRRNIPYLRKLFDQTPIDIRNIISLIDGSKMWPKVSHMTGVENYIIYEMIDAQYPHLPPLRPVRKNPAAVFRPAPPQETAYSMLFNPRFDISTIPKSLVLNAQFIHKYKIDELPTDQANSENTPYEFIVRNGNANAKHLRKLLIQATKYFYENEILADLHDGRPPIKSDVLSDEHLKDFYNEYDAIDNNNPARVSHPKTAKHPWARLSVDRVSPAVYCIIYGNLLYLENNKSEPCFRIYGDTYEDTELLRIGDNNAYAEKNRPRVVHWKETREKYEINSYVMCRLLRVSKQTLSRWENGYRAPLSIRIFFDLFKLYPLQLMDMLIRIQDEIIENFLIKLRDIFKHLEIEYPSALYGATPAGPVRCVSIDAPNLEPPDATGRCGAKFCPKCAPHGERGQPKLRRYKGRVVRSALPPPENHGAYHLVGPVIAPKSKLCTYEEFVLGLKNPFEFAKSHSEMSINELNELAAIHELVLPLIVRKK